jgi:hypothetical protein
VSLPPPRLSVGETLADAWRLYTQNSWRLIATAGIGYGVLALIQIVIAAAVSTRFAFTLVSLLLTVVAVFWLQGALVLLVQELRAGRPAPPMLDLFARVELRLWTLLGAGLLAGFGIAVGLILFVLPGLALLTYWSLATPVVVLEGRSAVDALRRSAQLVRGNALRAFGVIVVTVVASSIVGLVVTGLLQPVGGAFGYYLAAVVANAITIPFVALAWTEMYFALRSGG